MNIFKKLFGDDNSAETPAEENAKNVEVLKYDGVRAMKTGQIAYAIQCFEHVLDIQDDLEVRDYLSQCYIHNNELRPAYEQLQKLAEIKPDNIEIFIRMARVAYMMEDYEAMAADCEKAKLLDKDNAEIDYLNAQACIGQGNMIGAIAMLTRAIALDDKFAAAYLLRGNTLRKMGDVKSSDEDAAWLLQHTENNEDVLMLKARIEEAKGEHDNALEYYNKVVDVNPFAIDAFRERGAVKLVKGDKEGAEEDMKQVLELNPQEAESVNGKYQAEGREGQDIQQRMKQKYKENNPYGF